MKQRVGVRRRAVTHTVPDCGDCNGWRGSCGRLFWGMFQRHRRGRTWALEIWRPSSHCLIKTHTCGEKMERLLTCLRNSCSRLLRPRCKDVAGRPPPQEQHSVSDFTDLPLEAECTSLIAHLPQPRVMWDICTRPIKKINSDSKWTPPDSHPSLRSCPGNPGGLFSGRESPMWNSTLDDMRYWWASSCSFLTRHLSASCTVTCWG